MLSLFCGPSKSRRGRRKKKNSNSFSSQCSEHSSDSENSSSYHTPYLEKEPRSGVGFHSSKNNNNNNNKSLGTVSKESVALSSHSVLDLKDFLTKSNSYPLCVGNNSTRLSTIQSTLDLNDNNNRVGSNVFQSSDEYEDIGSISNLSIIDRINKLTGMHISHNRSNSRFRRRPKSMMTSSFKNLTSSAGTDYGDRLPLKRAHSARFKGATIHEDEVFKEINEENDEDKGSTLNIIDQLLLHDYHSKANNNISTTSGVVSTRCKLRRTRSGVSNCSSVTRRSLGSNTNLSAVERLSVSSVSIPNTDRNHGGM